jgi:hypothetical protein
MLDRRFLHAFQLLEHALEGLSDPERKGCIDRIH